MGVEAKIHAWWGDGSDAAAAALAALLPVASVFTGQVQDETQALPYATISKISTQDAWRTTCGLASSSILRLQIWHDSFDSGDAISAAAITCFDNQDRLSADILSMRRSNDFSFQEDDGTWQFVIDFDVIYR